MLKLQNIRKTYRTSEVETRALDEVSIEIDAGEFVAVMGPSGCGKSTLLNILGLLDTPDEGSYVFCGRRCGAVFGAEAHPVETRRCRFHFPELQPH